MSGPGSYTKGMPRRGQKGGAINESLAQQSAQTPSPSTGSRQATHKDGSATSSASFEACDHASRHAASAPATRTGMERDDEAGSASIGGRLSSGQPSLKRQRKPQHGRRRRGQPCLSGCPSPVERSYDLHHPTIRPDRHASNSFSAPLPNRSFQAAPATRRGASRLGQGVETKTGRVQNRKYPLPPRSALEQADFQHSGGPRRRYLVLAGHPRHSGLGRGVDLGAWMRMLESDHYARAARWREPG